MRLTAVFALALFLVPTVYVVKYYAVDKPRETEYARELGVTPLAPLPTANALPYWEEMARDPQTDKRTTAIKTIGDILRQPGINYARPLECLTAKATLADLAVKDTNPAVRAAASEELGKVAQRGAVIRR